jgi:hypothetical protein
VAGVGVAKLRCAQHEVAIVVAEHGVSWMQEGVADQAPLNVLG